MNPMLQSCDERAEALSAWVDGELEESSALETHLSECPACRERADAFRALGGRLRALPPHALPESLRRKAATAGLMATPLRRRRLLVLGGVAAALVAVGALTLFALRPSRDADVLPVYLDDHVAIVQAQVETGVVSSDPAELEQWLGGRLDFATQVPRWPWASFTSARVCSLRGTRISLVRLRIGDGDASLFVHPPLEPAVSASGTVAKPVIHTSRGYETACWREGGLEYVLVASALDRDVFARLAER